MSEPTTPTGKALLAASRQDLDPGWRVRGDLPAAILAIEAEARHQERERLRALGLARYDDLRSCLDDDRCEYEARGVMLAMDDMGLWADPEDDDE